MLKSRALLFAMLFCVSIVVGCAGEQSTGHTEDTTPGGEATPPAEELMDDAAFDDYAKQQGKGG